jgi:hypothetical protein
MLDNEAAGPPRVAQDDNLHELLLVIGSGVHAMCSVIGIDQQKEDWHRPIATSSPL